MNLSGIENYVKWSVPFECSKRVSKPRADEPKRVVTVYSVARVLLPFCFCFHAPFFLPFTAGSCIARDLRPEQLRRQHELLN
jgi:hypothetical protein